jgi:hypothetical protein
MHEFRGEQTVGHEEIRFAFFVVWIIVSVVIFLVLLAPFVLSMDTLNAMVPVCEWKAKYNKECPLCGMTRSFVYISHGDFAQARDQNRWSVHLYAIFLVNEILALSVLAIKIRTARLVARLVSGEWPTVTYHKENTVCKRSV